MYERLEIITSDSYLERLIVQDKEYMVQIRVRKEQFDLIDEGGYVILGEYGKETVFGYVKNKIIYPHEVYKHLDGDIEYMLRIWIMVNNKLTLKKPPSKKHDNINVICISGKAEHGKDFSANALKEILEENGHTVMILHYADYLKFICSQYFGWNGQKDDKGREILQKVGTEKARVNNPDIWVNVLKELMIALGEEYDYFLIPDTRFPNEIEAMNEGMFKVTSIRVERIGHVSRLTEEQLQHRSEVALDDYKFDYVSKIINDDRSAKLNMQMFYDIFIKNA